MSGSHPSLPALLAVALSTASYLPAQNTWVVDANRGPGYDYADLQPAFDKAMPGDTVLVRKGAYNPASTNKGIRLFGVAGTTFKNAFPPTQSECLVVRGLPAGQSFVMKGLGAIDGPAGRTILLLDGNKGQVHLEALRLESYAAALIAQFTRPALFVRDSAQVTITGCHLVGRPGALCERSAAAFTNCGFVGAAAGQFAEIVWSSHPGLRATSSRLTIARSSSTGGAGAQTWRGVRPASPGVLLASSDSLLMGEPANRIEAGKLSSTETGMHAVDVAGGHLVVDPTHTLVPKGKGPPIRSTGKVLVARLQALTASGAAPGVVRTDLYAPAGNLQILLVSKPGPLVLLPIGDLWLDLGTLIVLDASVVDKTQHRALALSVPNDPKLLGTPLAFQVVGGSLSALALSNAVIVALQ